MTENMRVAATGFFDGVHKGHRAVVSSLVKRAKELDKRSCIVTFWPHPRLVVSGKNVEILTSVEEKRELLYKAGVDEVVVLPFTKELASMSTARFIKEYIHDTYTIDHLMVGYDHKVGHDNFNSFDEFQSVAMSQGVELEHLEPIAIDGCTISSTAIRSALMAGEIEQANGMLGYRYKLTGIVVEGLKNGRLLGFPTANMRLIEPLKVLPQNGVYAVEVNLNGKSYKGMTNIGLRPTIGKFLAETIETNIFGFNADIYGQEFSIQFCKKIRDERPFASLGLLSAQLNKDKVVIEEYFKNI